ncbi:MAG: hypothetical protein KDB94_13850 [Acidobacteria bacterium]|nr:hypothetical protein [Acidobacteriota bacterium]
MPTSRAPRLFVALLGLASVAPLYAALADPPHEDVHFLAEHVPEAAQDARWFALPWPVEPLEKGRWQSGLVVGGADAQAGPYALRGFLAAAGASRGFSTRWGLDLIGFVDRFSISGDASDEVLRAPFLDSSPLDLPERARFDNASGTVAHEGLAFGALRELSAPDAHARWTLRFGAFLEHLELSDYRVDFTLLGGADAGARGVLDHSSDATFVTPYFGAQRIAPLGEHWRLAWRFLAGNPFPAGDFDGRLTGPGYDLGSAQGDGSPGKIGDGFVSLGVAFVHPASGFDVDLGSVLAYPAFEAATHQGLDRAWLVQVGWHPHLYSQR